MNATDVNEFGALESVAFIPDGVTLTDMDVNGKGGPVQCPGRGWSIRINLGFIQIKPVLSRTVD